MAFHLGKPILVMLALALACGVAIMLRPDARPRDDLVLWVFADAHLQIYTKAQPDGASLVESFERRTGVSVDVQHVAARAAGVRLVSAFMSGMRGPEVPDLVEVEIGYAGKFFRPPVEDMGFLPLNDYLERSGWMERIVKSRFAPWSKKGVIFGVPHDVHPVALAYRHDLWTEAGIDLLAESADPARPLTWDRFQTLALQFKRYWGGRGKPDRHPIELRTSGVDELLVMLLQRRLNLVDQDDAIQFTRPKFVQTVARFALMVAGERRIASQSGVGEAAQVQDLNGGNLCAFFAPDWRVRYIKMWSSTDPATGQKILEGRMRLIPLPVFEAGDARTATWGGTMIAIPRACPRPDDAWKLIEHLYLSKAGFEAQTRETSILPPVIEHWSHPVFQRADPFFGGQHIDRIYIDLADEIPERYVTPATTVAAATLLVVVHKAIAHVNAHGAAGLEAACAGWLEEAAQDLQRRIDWGKFE